VVQPEEGTTQGDAANAIKDALLNGITNGVKIVSVKDGYFGNSLIKIPFPTEAQPIVSALQMIGAGSLVDKLVCKLTVLQKKQQFKQHQFL
jgi:hypothetical protein